jgi:hypothetical protein
VVQLEGSTTFSSDCDNAKASLTARPRGVLYNDFDVPAQQRQEMHKPFRGEARELAAKKPRDFWLINFQYPGCVRLSQPARTNSVSDANGERGLCEALFRIWQAKIGEDIAAAFLYFDCFSHCSFVALCRSSHPAWGVRKH